MIDKVRYWCHRILPLTYDDSLSYYEVLAKLTNKINEVIDTFNSGIDPQILTRINQIFASSAYDATTKTLTLSFNLPEEDD